MKKPELLMLIGLPGSGKSTFANKYKKYSDVYLSSDKIREELYGNESIQGDPKEVFYIMQNRAIEALNAGNNVIYDATNITRKDRASIIGRVPSFATITAYIIWAPIDICMDRDSNRERSVGKEVIDRMVKRFQPPFYDEGIDNIKVHFSVKDYNFVKYEFDILKNLDIPHDNPYHSVDIKEHCHNAEKYIEQNSDDKILYYAARFHDIGKPYTKSFVNTKGEVSDIAHYYSHANVGAWMSYGATSLHPTDMAYVAWLIGNHMEPFNESSYYKKLPNFLKKDLDLLHKADIAAK